MNRAMRALSIRQPYAELILRGIKTAELRSMSTTDHWGTVLHLRLQSEGEGREPIWSDDLRVGTPPAWMIELAEQVKLIEAGAILPTGVIVGSAVIDYVTEIGSQGSEIRSQKSQSLDEIKFSAVGYFFAAKLFKELNVPIGMIEATAGGTHVEGWMAPNAFTDPALADFAKAAQTPKTRFAGTVTTALYNGMIAPMVPYAIRGVLWYQGESNLIKNDPLYANKIKGLITSWRANWGSDLPFYYVQLPDLYYSKRKNPGHNPTDEAFFREQQDAALTLPKTGVAVTTDIGDLNNMHPPNKKPVGERLALWALANEYGRKDVEPSGPMYRPGSIEREGFKAVVHFTHVGKGLVSKDGQPLTGFTAAGDDGIFHPADAAISGDAVVVTSSQVKEPKEVRFDWDEAAVPNLYNKDGLPAAPFRTDHQPPPAEPAQAPPATNGPAATPDAAPQ